MDLYRAMSRVEKLKTGVSVTFLLGQSSDTDQFKVDYPLPSHANSILGPKDHDQPWN